MQRAYLPSIPTTRPSSMASTNHDQALGYLQSLKFQHHSGRLGQIFLLKAVINAHSVYCEYLHKRSLRRPHSQAATVLKDLPSVTSFMQQFIGKLVEVWWEECF
mmetsp:Transcript_14049/g.42311  ORF Transcript_14049/g.42311 Transcript_14049/m.42311 type:complete len:104 (-) Transcript_14049:41-352(-)